MSLVQFGNVSGSLQLLEEGGTRRFCSDLLLCARGTSLQCHTLFTKDRTFDPEARQEIRQKTHSG